MKVHTEEFGTNDDKDSLRVTIDGLTIEFYSRERPFDFLEWLTQSLGETDFQCGPGNTRLYKEEGLVRFRDTDNWVNKGVHVPGGVFTRVDALGHVVARALRAKYVRE